ncbi:MAG TPA: hypothetical protein VM737_10630 [Gemmatimonadota bacterium]|nr:hypothetical protein [Gemmatimonadota bacterium]
MMRSRIAAGVVAGLIAGLVFGFMMQVTPMPMVQEGGMSMPMGDGAGMSMPAEGRTPMIMMFAETVRSESLIAGWIYILVSSVVIGGIFGIVLGGRAAKVGAGLAWGALYGVLVWFLGALILMPILGGMEPFAPLTMAPMRPVAMTGLAGHLLSGLILGGVFAGLYDPGPPASHPAATAP